MEKRKFMRVQFNAEVVVKSSGITISGTTDNLSMKGMFLNTTTPMNLSGPIEVSLGLAGSELSITLKAKAVRQTDAGIAIEFIEMDLDSFTHLKTLIAYNSDNADAVEDEYYKTLTRE